MALFELDDVFTYQDANDIKKLWAAETAPSDPAVGEVWLDISAGPLQLKRYNGTGWDVIAGTTASELLESLKTVDGSGSGLDADQLDGQEGSFYQNAGNLNAGTIPLARVPTVLTGKDADKLDGQEGSFYQNASNLNAGTVPLAQIPATLTGKSADQLDGLEGTQFIRNDVASDVGAHTEWQDGYQVRIGSSADVRIQHDGLNSYVDNYTGDFYLRQLLNGGNIYLQAENASGAVQNLLTLDPDAQTLESSGSILSKKYVQTLSNNEILMTDITHYAQGLLIIGTSTQLNRSGVWILTRDGVGDIVKISAASIFSTTQDTNYLLNVYYENGKVCIQNKTGFIYTVHVGFFGVRLIDT